MTEHVRIAETRIGRSPSVLKAYGLGSCVAVGLYDPETGLGGLGQMLLPDWPKDVPAGSENKYVDAGIRQIVNYLVHAGANRNMLISKISGGANMFVILPDADQQRRCPQCQKSPTNTRYFEHSDFRRRSRRQPGSHRGV